EDRRQKFAPFIIARVSEVVKHPNADRLRVCQVDIGQKDNIQVVCGAPNVKRGMVGVFAPVGAHIPGTDLLLKSGNIRGQSSNGMLCSKYELELSNDHDGVIELDKTAPIGASYAQWAGLDDPVIEIAITPNRGDCLGVYGIARDLAASGIGKLKKLDKTAYEGHFKSLVKWQISERAKLFCPFVSGRMFKIKENPASPEWMQNRLKAIGLRPISALVDITNYLTFDLGRPLHVFDYDKLKGKILRMDLAKNVEKITALDGQEYQINSDEIVIYDVEKNQQDRAVSIAGIMGGLDTGCDEQTRHVFMEAAYFDPIITGKTGRRTGILSDARYRFERGVDPQSCIWGNDIASRLIVEICGGEASYMVKAGDVPTYNQAISLNPIKVKSYGGLDIKWQDASEKLQKLGFDVQQASAQ
ncbi:MAG: YtpR family tRNA-binding protein, partial [Pseudomonadota bacterium]